MKGIAKVIGRTIGLSAVALILGVFIIRFGTIAISLWGKYQWSSARIWHPIIHGPAIANAVSPMNNHPSTWYLHNALTWASLTVVFLVLLVRPLRYRGVR